LLRERGSFNLVQNGEQKGPVLKPKCIGPGRARTQIPFYSILLTHPNFLNLPPFNLAATKKLILRRNHFGGGAFAPLVSLPPCYASDGGTGFCLSTSVFSVSIIPPLLHTHLHLYTTLIRRTNG